MENETSYVARAGARLLSVANDLKRTPEALAKDLNMAPAFVLDAVAGKVTYAEMVGLLQRVYEAYSISMNELWVDRDQTDAGVLIVRAEESSDSSRVFERTDGYGQTSPYYEYRDTAMARTAPYKPEWIKQIKVVANADPDNPHVVYNKGHLMHQQTFFIGSVNFYWTLNGKNYCQEMNTGDSNYITPFVPHSFTSRDADAPGLIIAITFAGNMQAAFSSMNYISGDDMETWVGDKRDPIAMFVSNLTRQCENEMLTLRQLSDRLRALGVATADELISPEIKRLPDSAEIAALAQALNILPSELAIDALSAGQEVVTKAANKQDGRPFPDSNDPSYIFYDLARSPHMPGLKGFNVKVLASNKNPVRICHGLHEYIYNYGDVPVQIDYGDDRREELRPGDSAYVSPRVSHCFTASKNDGALVMVRVAGGLTKESIDELSTYPVAKRKRAKAEITRWY